MEKLKAIWCVFFGHSKIVTTCFGYVSCTRCDTQLGDTLGAVFPMQTHVIVGHDCDKCHKNYDNLKWHDKIFCPYPLFEEFPTPEKTSSKN